MNEKIVNSISDLLKDKKSDKIILDALKTILPTCRRWIFIILTLIIFVFMFNKLFCINDPVGCALKVFKSVNVLLLPILTIAITGYAIFQALVSGSTLITLLETKGEEYSKFKEYNFFFLSFSILYLFSVILNFILVIIFSNISHDIGIPFFSDHLNTYFFTSMLSVYIVFIINLLVELKCFLFNLHQVFVTNAIANGIEEVKNRNGTKSENE